jgi:hypothetical protein
MLDNHMVELVVQDKQVALQVAGQGLKKLSLLFPESSILTPSHPYGEDSVATSLCTWSVPINWHTCLVTSTTL